MTQVFDADGTVVPVTVIEAGPCKVLALRTPERDGYAAVQVGFLDKPRRLASRAVRGQVAVLESKRGKRRAAAGVAAVPKADSEPQRYIREFRGTSEGIEVGHSLTVELFEGVERVDVCGTTKGRGTAGVMKRHGFKGQRATHGVKKVHRHPGSTGMRQTPGRVFKGHCMPGQLGNARTTIRNLKVFKVDVENHLILLHGAVPGPNGGYLVIRETNKV